MADKKALIVITGPTASGKSALAVELARELQTEIISADSRQVFTGIPIATAMPSPEERAAVKHHLIDFLPLEAYYSAATFEQDAMRLLTDIFARTDYAVVCGGSMMYVDALCNGIDPLPTVSEALRSALTEEHRRYGDNWLRMRLLALDEHYYHRVDLLNIKRVFHAVEVSMQAGVPYSSLLSGEKCARPFNIIKVMLEWPRPLLFDRINARVDKMVEAGLIEEVESVKHLRGLNSLNTVGIKEIFALFDGTFDLPTALSRMAKNTRVYAKKQMTWFKRDQTINHLDMTSTHPLATLLSLLRP